MLQPQWRRVWIVLKKKKKKLKIEFPYDLAIPFMGIYLDKIII